MGRAVCLCRDGAGSRGSALMSVSIKDKIEAAKVASDPAELRRYAADSFVYLREGVAMNPAATLDILLSLVPEELRSDQDFQVAAALLSREALPPELARRLCEAVKGTLPEIQPRDYQPREFWKRLMSHPGVSFSHLAELLAPRACPRHLRGDAAASSTRADVLEHLGRDESGAVAARARKRMTPGSDGATRG